jgi:hypothetical protein
MRNAVQQEIQEAAYKNRAPRIAIEDLLEAVVYDGGDRQPSSDFEHVWSCGHPEAILKNRLLWWAQRNKDGWLLGDELRQLKGEPTAVNPAELALRWRILGSRSQVYPEGMYEPHTVILSPEDEWGEGPHKDKTERTELLNMSDVLRCFTEGYWYAGEFGYRTSFRDEEVKDLGEWLSFWLGERKGVIPTVRNLSHQSSEETRASWEKQVRKRQEKWKQAECTACDGRGQSSDRVSCTHCGGMGLFCEECRGILALDSAGYVVCPACELPDAHENKEEGEEDVLREDCPDSPQRPPETTGTLPPSVSVADAPVCVDEEPPREALPTWGSLAQAASVLVRSTIARGIERSKQWINK